MQWPVITIKLKGRRGLCSLRSIAYLLVKPWLDQFTTQRTRPLRQMDIYLRTAYILQHIILTILTVAGCHHCRWLLTFQWSVIDPERTHRVALPKWIRIQKCIITYTGETVLTRTHAYIQNSYISKYVQYTSKYWRLPSSPPRPSRSGAWAGGRQLSRQLCLMSRVPTGVYN